MKRLPMIMILLAAALTCAFFGASSFILSASSQFIAKPYHANSNYYYLTNPKMLTVGAGNAYVLNEQDLLTFNTTGDLIQPTPYNLGFDPVFIKYTQGLIFLFEQNGFSVISSNDFTSRTISSITITNITDIKFFDVFYIPSINAYRVFFASATYYGWNDYKTVAGSGMINPSPFYAFKNQSPFIASTEISSIACDGANFLYICTSEIVGADEPPEYNIYQVNQVTQTFQPRVNSRFLSEFTSFATVQNKDQFIYIDRNGSLTLFDRYSNDLFSEPLDTDDSVYRTDKSRKPIFATVEGQKYVYVIDGEKRSVDRYIIKEDSLGLVHEKVIAGYRGGDSGFFNRPTSITLIDTSKRLSSDTSSEYLITDRAGQITYNIWNTDGVTSKPFFTDPSIRLADNSRATYDNFDTVYIYDYDSANQRNRIRTFTLDGVYNNREFVDFGARVSHMFADSNRTVYVLDATRNSIYFYSPTTMSASVNMSMLPAFETAKGTNSQNPEYEITTSSQGAYHEQLNAIILSSVKSKSTGNIETLILPLDIGIAPQILNITSKSVIGVTPDNTGNILVLSLENNEYFISLYQLQKNSAYVTIQEWESKIEEATVNTTTPSLCLDTYNRRLLYIGARHAIEAIQLSETDISSPRDYIHDESWKSPVALDIYTSLPGSVPIFVNANVDTVVYEYPGSVHALALAPKNSVFKVLQFEVPNYKNRYVLYENSVTGEYIKGYVLHKAVSAEKPYSSTLKFKEARVMFSNTQVFKYPTADRRALENTESLALLTLKKNFEQSVYMPYLCLSNKVTVTDVRGFFFYEIYLSKTNGIYSPDPNGAYVGYVKVDNVIDYNLGPSQDRFIPNATIKILPSHFVSQVPVYESTGIGEFVELQDEFLKPNQAIRIAESFNRNKEYTYICYYDTEIDDSRYGWIETKYIVPNGLTAVQIIAIASLILVVLIGIVLIVIKIRKRNNV